MSYGFRPMTAEDLPMVRRWLTTPDVRLWWGDPDEQYALIGGDIPQPEMRQWIVANNGRPFAYLQDYDPHIWDVHAFDADLPTGARGVDPFIGEVDMIGCGHGAAMLRMHSERVLAEGAPAVFIDPAPDNARAIRAYRRAGFAPVGLRPDGDGEQVLLMARSAST